MGLKTSLKQVGLRLKARYYLHRHLQATAGCREWLVAREQKYGGLITEVRRNKVSPDDPRSSSKIASGGMTGGDRMLNHGYADKYAQCLQPFLNCDHNIVMVECGILMGTGLAMWCDLFPEGRILGLDIDLGHTRNNMDNLKSLGAFTSTTPELFEFDQFVDNTAYLQQILKGDRIDIFIDDGFHSDESILNTMKDVKPHLADKFMYIIEDNQEVHAHVRSAYPEFAVDNQGELTVVSNR